MPDRVSFANIGLVYLENAILDALGKSSYRPENLARMLGLYPNIKVGDWPAGNQIVRAILESLEQDGRVQRCSGYPSGGWKLTVKERHLRLRL